MRTLILNGYEILTVALPFLAVFRRRLRHEQDLELERPACYYAGLLLFACYLAAVYHLTRSGTLFDGLFYGFRLRPDEINLIPFSRETDVTYPLNVLLFLPFGFLTPLIWQKWDDPRRVAGAALLFSLLIEVSQLLNHRFSDVDDLIINLCGALLGWGLFRLTRKSFRRRRQAAANDAPPGWELPLYILATMAGRFFLFDEFWAARLLYGF